MMVDGSNASPQRVALTDVLKLCPRDIAYRVQLPRHQHGNAGVRVGNLNEFSAAVLWVPLPPIIRIRLQDQPVVRAPFPYRIGARCNGLVSEGLVATRLDVRL